MDNMDVLLPWVAAMLVAGCVISILLGHFVHWIPILLALGVVGAIASSAQR